MKKQITCALLGFAMLFVLVASASAQTARRIAVQIPFDFVAGRTQLPAGKYTVRRFLSNSESALLFESEDGRSKATVITNSGGSDAPTSAQVVFRQYGERYFLASVSMPGTASVRVAPESKAEKKIARELIEQAKADAASKSVTIIGSVQ
jgi:hypothetical protein